MQRAAETQSSEPRTDQSTQSPPYDCEGTSSKSAMADPAAVPCRRKPWAGKPRRRTSAHHSVSWARPSSSSQNSFFGSGRAPVASEKDRLRDNVSEPLDRARAGCVLAKRKVSPDLIIVAGVFRKNAPKVIFVQHDHVVRALVPRRPDQALN